MIRFILPNPPAVSVDTEVVELLEQMWLRTWPSQLASLFCSFIGDNVQVLEVTTLFVGHNRKTFFLKMFEGLMLSLKWEYFMKIQTLKKFIYIYIILHLNQTILGFNYSTSLDVKKKY